MSLIILQQIIKFFRLTLSLLVYFIIFKQFYIRIYIYTFKIKITTNGLTRSFIQCWAHSKQHKRITCKSFSRPSLSMNGGWTWTCLWNLRVREALKTENRMVRTSYFHNATRSCSAHGMAFTSVSRFFSSELIFRTSIFLKQVRLSLRSERLLRKITLHPVSQNKLAMVLCKLPNARRRLSPTKRS